MLVNISWHLSRTSCLGFLITWYFIWVLWIFFFFIAHSAQWYSSQSWTLKSSLVQHSAERCLILFLLFLTTCLIQRGLVGSSLVINQGICAVKYLVNKFHSFKTLLLLPFYLNCFISCMLELCLRFSLYSAITPATLWLTLQVSSYSWAME